MSAFLAENRDKVIELMLDEWNYDMALKIAADEAREKALCKLIHYGCLTLEHTTQFVGIIQAEFTDCLCQCATE